MCAGQGLNLNRRFRVNEDLTVLNLVAEGLGLTLTARSHIKSPDFSGRIVALPHFRASVDLCIGYLEENESRPAIAAARDVVLGLWSSPINPQKSPATLRRPVPRSRR